MLVLTRKVRETIEIDGGITITIVEVRDGKVRVGVDAPPDAFIKRGELPGAPVASARHRLKRATEA